MKEVLQPQGPGKVNKSYLCIGIHCSFNTEIKKKFQLTFRSVYNSIFFIQTLMKNVLFYIPVNSYGHIKTVSSHNTTLFEG